MAPEQIEHPGKVDHRADIYSLGVVFYEMLTGQLPIGQFAPPSQKVHVDVRLDKVVLKSLAHEPERRYQHASEVKTDVETITQVAAAPKFPAADVGLPAKDTKTSGMAIASLMLGILGFCTAGLSAIVGAILGIIGLRAIGKSAGRLKGRGLAIAGIVVSCTGFVLYGPILLAIILPALTKAQTAAKATKSMANAHQIAIAIAMYEDENDGKLPPADSWPDALEPYLGLGQEFFSSPFDPDAGRAWAMNSNLRTLNIKNSSKIVLFFEAEFGSPPGGGPELLPQEPRWRRGYIIGFADCHIENVLPKRLDELIWEP